MKKFGYIKDCSLSFQNLDKERNQLTLKNEMLGMGLNDARSFIEITSILFEYDDRPDVYRFSSFFNDLFYRGAKILRIKMGIVHLGLGSHEDLEEDIRRIVEGNLTSIEVGTLAILNSNEELASHTLTFDGREDALLYAESTEAL